MVYKGVKYLCYLNVANAIRNTPDEILRAHGISPAAWKDSWSGVSSAQILSAKRSMLGGSNAVAVAQTASALTNQSGGNIGFTYE